MDVQLICISSGSYELELTDVYQQLLLAKVEQIIAISTLIKKFSLPLSKIIGEMPDTKCTLPGMDLRINK